MSDLKKTEDSKLCDNCKKSIPQNKYSLHIITCKELNIPCEHCEEIINKYEIEEHNEEFHTLLDCLDCGKKFEKRSHDSHQKKCINKPIHCQYCDLRVGKSDLHEHEYVCGSKTERCINCEKFIQIREYDLHLLYECGDNKSNPKNVENQDINTSLTEKLISSPHSILYDSKANFSESLLGKKTNSLSNKEIKKTSKVIKDDEDFFDAQNLDSSLKNKTNSDLKKETEKNNKNMPKPKPIKSGDFYNLKPIAKDSNITPITITKQTIIKSKNYVNPPKREKIQDKKEVNKNRKKILDEINSEYDLMNRNLNSNIYNPNKENFNTNLESEEFYNDCETFNANFLNERLPASNRTVIDKNTFKKGNSEFINKRDRSNFNPNSGDYSDYHLLQNHQEDIAYDDAELIKILEKSKHEK